MKKLLSIILVCVIICFVGCGSDNTSDQKVKPEPATKKTSSKATLYVASDDGIMGVEGFASEDEMSFDDKEDLDEMKEEDSVIKMTVDKTNVVIPMESDGKNIMAIGEDAFKNCSLIKTITVPETIRMIEEGAFGGCSKDLVLKVKKDSAALEFAKKNSIKYEIIK